MSLHEITVNSLPDVVDFMTDSGFDDNFELFLRCHNGNFRAQVIDYLTNDFYVIKVKEIQQRQLACK